MTKLRVMRNSKRIFLLVFFITMAAAAFALGLANPKSPAGDSGTGDTIMLVVYVSLALIFSFLCSVTEAVLLSVTPIYIAGLKEKKPKKAALLRRLKQENIERSLAAILTLNTIANTAGAVGAGSKAIALFGSAWFGLFSAMMTLMILFLSEIIPKTLGALYWRRLAGAAALFVRALIVCLYPLILISERLTRFIARGQKKHVFSRDEFVAMAGLGEKAGHINERESRIIHNLFRFQSLKAKHIMTPRTVMVALKDDLTVNQALDTEAQAPFSRLPIYKTDLDHITGFILKDDMLLSKAKGRGEMKLGELKREVVTVPGGMPLTGLLEFLLDQRQQIAIVVDSYGGTKGLVTLEDVVETLLGMEIVDEIDTVEDMQALARQQWTKRAKALGLEVDDLK